jgi:glutathione S-transferase
MKLFYTPTSPYARKIRILLREKGMHCEEVQPSLNDAALSALNPLGKVPTLVADDQTPMFDSVVISDYLELVQTEPRMIPVDRWERVVVRRWEAVCDGICDVLVTAVLELRRAPESQDAAIVAKADHKLRAALKFLDTEIAGHTFALGNSFTLADASLIVAHGYVKLRRNQLLEGFASLQAYAERHAERASVLATAPPT